MFGLTTTRRLRAELAAAKAETERVRQQLAATGKERNAFRSAALTAAVQFATADEELMAARIVNTCLTEDLTQLRAHLTNTPRRAAL